MLILRHVTSSLRKLAQSQATTSAAHTTPRPTRVRLTAGVASVLMAGTAVAFNAQSAAAWTPYCGESEFVHEIRVEDWADGQQKISITPKGETRVATDARAATTAMWHAVQDCVSGLYGTRADTVYDQLQCHQFGAAAWFATGETYDLETWRPPFDVSEYVSSHCGNKLGADPAGPTSGHYRPDTGATDLQGAYDSIA